jgi:xylan 1,4-beta-xylosidase
MRFHANLGGNMRFEFLAILAGAALAASAHAADSTPIAVTIDVDARATGPELTRIWRFFGADEPNYATMKD